MATVADALQVHGKYGLQPVHIPNPHRTELGKVYPIVTDEVTRSRVCALD